MSSLHTNVSTRKIANIFWPLLVIIIVLSAEIAAICSLNFAPIKGFIVSGQGWPPFQIAAPMAGLLVGLPIWWRYVLLAESVTITRGILVGCLGSIAAHPIMWIIIDASMFLKQIFTQPLDPNTFSGSGMLFLVVAIGLIYTGWITTIAGGIAGALLAYLQRALTREIEPPNKNIR